MLTSISAVSLYQSVSIVFLGGCCRLPSISYEPGKLILGIVVDVGVGVGVGVVVGVDEEEEEEEEGNGG